MTCSTLEVGVKAFERLVDGRLQKFLDVDAQTPGCVLEGLRLLVGYVQSQRSHALGTTAEEVSARDALGRAREALYLGSGRPCSADGVSAYLQ